MDAAAELGRNPVSKHRISLSMEMRRLTRYGTAEPVTRDQIFRCEHGQGNIHFTCSADHVHNWQPYPVDPYSCYICDHTLLCTTNTLYFDKGLIAFLSHYRKTHKTHSNQLSTYSFGLATNALNVRNNNNNKYREN